jgi:hypothetical protein
VYGGRGPTTVLVPQPKFEAEEIGGASNAGNVTYNVGLDIKQQSAMESWASAHPSSTTNHQQTTPSVSMDERVIGASINPGT